MFSFRQTCWIFYGFCLMEQLGFISVDECSSTIFEEIKTGENATFKITSKEAYYNDIWVYRETDGNNIPVIVVYPHQDTPYPGKTNYKNRIVLNRTENGITITLINVTSSDGGLYYIKYSLKWSCYTIHISGPPSTPVITVMGSYSGLEEHNHVRFNCSSHSTAFPGRDIFISWKINGAEVQKLGDDRFEVVDGDFWIHNVFKQDNGSDVLCEATDDNGKTSVSSETLKIVVYWGPDSVSLIPTNMIYHVARGTKINPITASADCNPPCVYTWRKRGKNESLSTNATLKIEVASEGTEGEYIFSAMRNGTTKTTSIFILLDKDTHGPWKAALTVGIVVFVLVVLLTIGICLYKRGFFGQCRVEEDCNSTSSKETGDCNSTGSKETEDCNSTGSKEIAL